jgi:starvation-inducible outer membrane lipoprotein
LKGLKRYLIFALCLLSGCATVPPPPHCDDTGTDIKPVNPEMLSQEQVQAVRKSWIEKAVDLSLEKE